MNKHLLTKNISCNVQDYTPSGVEKTSIMKSSESFSTRTISLSRLTLFFKPIMLTLAILVLGISSVLGQINYSFNFDANSTGWTGNFTRFTGTTACGGSGGAMRRNLYSGTTTSTGQLISPSTGTSNGASATVSYSYKAAVWSANTAAASNWGNFQVQYGATATGPWTTIATITNEAQLGNACISKSHTVTLPAGATFIRFNATWASGDYYLNFDNLSVVQSAGSACTGTPAPGNTISSAASVVSGSTVNLSLQNATAGSGVTYQWQSGTSSTGPWTNFGSSAPTQTSPSITSATWFRCNVTCGANTGNSTPVQVTLAYCTPTSTTDDATGVTFVGFNTISNASVGTPAYTNNIGISTSVSQNTAYPLTVRVNTAGAFTVNVLAWIDWNQNLTFEVSEQYNLGSANNVTDANTTASPFSITVPGTALLGNTRMRVRATYNVAPTACGDQSYSEAEDYTINVSALIACSGTPAPGNTISSAASVASGSTVNLSLQNATVGSGVTYAWESGPSSTGPWTVFGSSASTQTSASLTTTTWFRCRVICAGNTGTSNPVQVTVTASNNIPFTGSSSVACGTSTLIYDHGGSAGTYLDNANGYIVLNNNVGSTSVISLTGTYTTEANFDYLNIYDGTGTAGTLIASYSGIGTIAPFTSAAGQTITIQFTSDGSVNGAGISLSATYSGSCSVPPCSGTPNPGATTATSSQVFAGGSTTLGITNPQSGSGISYVWQSGPSASGPWSPIGGATSSTYLASPTTSTYYQCVVTCSNGGATGTSTPILISVNPYCEPVYTVGKTDGDLISNISISGTALSNNSGTAQVNPSYTFFTGQPNYTANLVAANSYNVTVTVGTWGTQGIAAWIDYNDNNIFEASEKIGNTAGTIGTGTGSTPIPADHTATFTINLSCNPALGTHRMRVRDVFNVAGPLIDPCAIYTFGETEDYLVTIVPGAPFTPTFSSTPTTPNCVGTPVTYTATAGQTNYVWTFPGTAGVDYTLVSGGTSTSNTAVVVYNNTGLQTISMDYASPLGCASAGAVTNTITITTPIVTASATATTVCAGDAVTLTGGGASTYAWTGGVTNGVAFTPAASATYTVTGTSAAGCTSTASIAITVNPLPIVTASANATTVCAGDVVTLTGGGASTYAWTGGVTDGVAFTATSSATYTVTGTNAAGCTSTASIAITVNPLPTVTASATATTVCDGDAVTLTGGGASTYAWTGGVTDGVAFTPTSSATYTVTGTNAAGCTSTDAIAINVNPLPTVTASATATTVCDGDAVTLTGGGASTYLWTGGVTDGVAFTPTASTTYTVTGTSAAGCTSTDAIAITVNPLPAISCPSDITVGSTNGSCGEIVNFSASSSTVPAPTITYSPASGSTFTIGTTVVTATATTAEGCVSTCTFNVTVTSSGTSNWLGSISNDWFDSGNWCGGIPTATSDVEISTGAPFMPIIATTGAIAKNITINSGASLTMDGTAYLTIVGNWTNNGTFTATSGDVNFNGSSSQILTGATTFFNLDLNNSAGLTINSNVNVNGLCQLVSGILTTGSNVLQITNGGYLSATTGYVNGYLKKYIGLADFYESFEVGSLTAYTPANISFNNVLSAGYLTVNTISSDHPSISSSALDGTKTVNRYWNLVGSGLTFDFYDVDLSYALADKDAGFIDMYAGAKIYSGSTWNVTTPNFGTANSLSIGTINTLGSIQIGIFNPTPVAISLSPNYGYIGLTSNIVFNGIGFVSGATSVNPVAGVTINSTTVNNDSTMTVNISVSPSALTGLRKFAITNITNAPGFGGTSDSLDFTISSHPVAAFYSNRSFIRCNVSGNVEFINNSTGGTSYYWDFGAGANPATATGNGPYTVTYSTTGLKTVKLIAYSPLGNDTLTRVNYITVTSAAPLIPASISGPLNINCTSSPVTHVYSAPHVNDVSYNWTVPAGATITSGLGTSAIVVNFSGTFTSGTISLSESNGCGTSATRSIVVTKTTATPGVISGNTVVCGLSTTTYSIAAVPGATSYTWTLPTGVTSSLGTSPIVTSATSLSVVFAPTFISGTISVTANNACSSSPARTLAIGIAPKTPGVISGSSVVCGLSSTTYSIAAVPGATSYTWTLPTGVTSSLGISPITTSVTSLPVVISSTFISGTISVTANTTCSSSAARTLPISNAPSTPASVSGPLASCGLTSSTYTVAATPGATSYTWTLPTGITSTVGPSPIVTSGTSLVVNFASTFTNGNISVTANNSCASSVARTISVSNVPSSPVAVYGNSMVCGISSSSYTITAISGATSYTWTLPSGVTCSLGASPITTTSTTLLLDFATSFSAGTLSVQANNSCGTSIAKTYAISRIPAIPSSISGLTLICGVSTTTYSVPVVTGATSYTWTLPTGVTSALGASPVTTTGTGITVNLASTFISGTISVTANNACASSAPKTLAINNKPAVPASISGPTVVCGTTSATYTAAASAGATSYIWTLPTGVTSTLGNSPITTTGTSLTVNISSIFASGSITVKASNSCATSLAKSLSISTAPPIPGLITGPTNICALATATYSIAAVTGATSYTWSLPTGVTSTTGASTITTTATSITVLIATNVATGPISVVANNACGSGATRSKSLTGCRSNNSDVQADSLNENIIEVNVYPNPTSDNVNIEFTSEIETKLLFELYDIQGKIILSKVEIITEGQNLLFYNVEELDKGIYFIKLTDEQSKMLITKKLVVQ